MSYPRGGDGEHLNRDRRRKKTANEKEGALPRCSEEGGRKLTQGVAARKPGGTGWCGFEY